MSIRRRIFGLVAGSIAVGTLSSGCGSGNDACVAAQKQLNLCFGAAGRGSPSTGAATLACGAGTVADCNAQCMVAAPCRDIFDLLGGGIPSEVSAPLQGCLTNCMQGGDGGVPPVPASAWQATFLQMGSTPFPAMRHDAVGSVNATQTGAVIANGDDGAQVACSVVDWGGAFEIVASSVSQGKGLEMTIGGMTNSATKAMPAKGALSIGDPDTSEYPCTTQQGNECDFYVVPGSGEGVGAGHFWLAFQCPSLTLAAPASICEGVSGYALFENCGQ